MENKTIKNKEDDSIKGVKVMSLFNDQLCEIEVTVENARQLSNILTDLYFSKSNEAVEKDLDHEQYNLVAYYEQASALLWSLSNNLWQVKKIFEDVNKIDIKSMVI